MPESVRRYEFTVTLHDAVDRLVRRIMHNPATFMKAIGGIRTYVAILALIKYVKNLPESELSRKITIVLRETESVAKGVPRTLVPEEV